MDKNPPEGAWKAIPWTSHAATTVVVDDPAVVTGKRVIAECDTEEYAQLIAAAPELFDACAALVAWCDKNPPAGEALYFVQLARDAVAKAKAKECPHCHGTGDATGQGHLDCVHCEAAEAKAKARGQS